MRPSSRTSRSAISRALLIAGLMLTAAVVLRLLAPDQISPELARRLLGVLLGLVVAGYANLVPKALAALTRMRCDPAADQAVRRFTGWSLALGGVAYAVTWAVAPLALAAVIAGGFLGGALLLVILRFTVATRASRG